MISYLHGIVQLKDEGLVTLNVNGVGYAVRVSTFVLGELEIGEEARLFVHTQVSESDITLYGFLEKDELTFFKQLISVSGVGPKTALGILASPPEIVKQSIISEDADTLAKFPGLGKKTAERIIVELKNKVDFEGNLRVPKGKIVEDEALEALTALGYSRYEALQMLSKVPEEIDDIEQRIKRALASR